MIFESCNIKGAYEITLEKHGDDRGFFARVFCEREFEALGLTKKWSQINISYSQAKGTLRGLHFQRAPATEVKLVRCVKGKVLDVFLDVRAQSATFGQHDAIVLDAEVKNSVYIPAGCAHGFQTLSDDAELLYFHSHAYEPGLEGGVNPLDPALNISWPLPVSQMSVRDQSLPVLSECEPL